MFLIGMNFESDHYNELIIRFSLTTIESKDALDVTIQGLKRSGIRNILIKRFILYGHRYFDCKIR